MTIAKSRLTTQGQISVPAEVRRKLGLGPGSVIEWDAEGETVIVRRAGRFSSEEIHRAVFPAPPSVGKTRNLKDWVRSYMRKRHARR